MNRNVREVLNRMTEILAEIGIIVFATEEYEGRYAGETIGVFAGYVPGRAAIFSGTFRLMDGSETNQLFQFSITSEHREWYREQFGIEVMRPERVRDDKDVRRPGGGYSRIPTFCYRWNGKVHSIKQWLAEASNPLGDKVLYAADLFGLFLKLHGETLVPRFSEHVVADVTPDHSIVFHGIEERSALRGKAIDGYFWLRMLGGIPDKLLENPGFPLPPIGVQST